MGPGYVSTLPGLIGESILEGEPSIKSEKKRIRKNNVYKNQGAIYDPGL